MLEALAHSLSDPAYWIQCVCAAVVSYVALDYPKKDRSHPVRMAGKLLFLILSFLSIHVVLSLLAMSYRLFAGIGTWLAYLGGVVIYTLIFPKNENTAKVVNAAAVSSIIITVFELGAVYGRFLELSVPGFDSIVTKVVACGLLLVAGWMMGKNRIARYLVSTHAAQLNFVACSVSAVCVMVYDLCAVHVFPFGGDASITGLMSVILLALFIINSVCYFMTYHLSREHTSVLNLTAEAQMNKSAESLMAVTEENLAELHKISHDIQNQYAYMRAMLDGGDIEGLRSYFDELTSTFAQPLVPIVDCGNHTMNLIFNMENSKARNLGVALDVRTATPCKLPFSDLDLVKLYTNVMDNAIEACVAEKVPNPVVCVTVNVVGEYLFTQIKNPTMKNTSFLESGLPTTKDNTRVHGKGMSIVRGIIKKYDGSICYTIQNGEFIVDFMLCLKEVPNE